MNNNNIETGLGNEITPSGIQALAQEEIDSAGKCYTKPERRMSLTEKYETTVRLPDITNLHKDSEKITPVDWLVKGYLESDTLSVLFGKPGIGKSFLALDLAACIASGKDWHGHKVKSGVVIYIAGEGISGLKRRYAAWRIHNEISTCRQVPIYLCNGAINGIESVVVNALCLKIKEIAGGKPVKLVVVDTLARNFFGNENNSEDMNLFITNMDAIRRALGCSVLLVHHPGHNNPERGRGSTVLPGAINSQYSVINAGLSIQLKPLKMKDAPMPEPFLFNLSTVDLGVKDEDGVMVFSAVVSKANPLQKIPQTQHTQSEKALQILKEMSVALSEGDINSAGRVHVDAWKKQCIEQGISDSPHWRSRILTRLKKDGLIKETKNPACAVPIDCSSNNSAI